MNNANVYVYKPGPVSRAFLQVVGLTATQLTEVTDQKSADIVLLTGMDDLRALYNEKQIFCVLQSPGQRIAPNQPQNVCLLDILRIFDVDNGITQLLAQIDRCKAVESKSTTSEVELPKFSDIAVLAKSYSVLVIDDMEMNLQIAKSVLDGQHVVAVRSLQAAIAELSKRSFDAVLTDMDMPPDEYYPSLNLDSYAVGEKVPYGFAIILEMTARGMPVAVVTDGNHHEGWVSAMFDHVKRATINGQKVLFFNNIRKRWDKALKSLMEE